ncbi:MAG: S8 family peptidase [Bacteroidia bacterium]
MRIDGNQEARGTSTGSVYHLWPDAAAPRLVGDPTARLLRAKTGLLITLFYLFLPFFAFSQIEINVKAKPRTPSAAFLELGAKTPDGMLRMRAPGMEHFLSCENARALSSRKNTEVAQIYTLRYAPGSRLTDKIAALQASNDFEWVEENRTAAVHTAAPNDPKVADQWYHERIETFAAWDSTRGDASVVVGILDTGIDYGHPEFDGQIAVKAAEDINGNGRFDPWPDTTTVSGVTGDFDGIDQDGNGYTDDVIGWDFTDQPRSPFGGDYLFEDADPMDDNNHGTLVSGIVAAKADNNYGGTGIAPGCRLKILRAFSASGSGEDDDIARAIVYAADNGIRILNCSFGDIYPSQMMHEAIQYAASKGVVIIASAGNGTGDNLHYPSNFDEVIAVSASALSASGTEFLWPLSSYGHAVSLCAPGSGILCPIIRDTTNEEDFDEFSGTSTSAPMVSAAVALLFSQRGACSPQEVRGILTTSADDLSNPGWDHFTGAGRLNIRKALQTVGASNVQILSPQNDGGSALNSVPIVVTALDPQGTKFHLEYQAGVEGEDDWLPILMDQTAQVFRDTLTIWNIAALDEGEYTLRLRMEKTNGSTAEDRVRFVIDRSAPVIDIRLDTDAIDNEQRKMFIVYRASDRSQVTLWYRNIGEPDFRAQVNDRITRHGSFLLGSESINFSTVEYYLTAKNEAGLISQTATMQRSVYEEHIPLFGWDTLTYSLPMGYYLDTLLDYDGDGLMEVAMSEYDEQLGFGKMKYYEYNAVQFTAVDSLNFKPVLIPKDVADTDGDGLQELLCSVNDSLYIVEQPTTNSYPGTIHYSNLGNGLYAARLVDTDDDGATELVAKDFKDYKILERSGSSYNVTNTLVDDSPDYFGSVAPRAMVEDVDRDGHTEVIFGDFDGDLLIYESNGSGGYIRTFLDTTDLTKSGSYILSGNFNGDTLNDFFVAVHSSLNRNEEDFEYEPTYWWLRLYTAVGDNQYQMLWQDWLYDVDTEEFNAATAGNVDADPEDEIVFTTFPRTYIWDHVGGSFKWSWFHYGDIATHHLIGDFDGNGINEVAIGRGDKAVFWEKDAAYAGTLPPNSLDGHVLGPNSNFLDWSDGTNAMEIRIWRGPITGAGNIIITLIDSVPVFPSAYVDNIGLHPDTTYLYVLEGKNTGLNPVYSPFTYAIALRPHALGRLDSVVAQGPQQAVAYFSVPMQSDPASGQYIVLNSGTACLAYNTSGDLNSSVLLSFQRPFVNGLNTLTVDSLLWDAARAPLDPAFRSAQFTYTPDTSGLAHFTRWEVVEANQARIWFNLPMNADVLEINRYALSPTGYVTDVQFADATQTSILVSLSEAALGALGYPVSITLHGGTAQDGALMMEKSGNVATFSAHQDELTQAYVYPNPYRPHDQFNGIRFANLTQTATVHVYTASGRKIITLEETDGDGGLEWNLIDLWGDRIVPGTYLFRVEAEGVEQFVGKFEILE